jgi:hypothetical protein
MGDQEGIWAPALQVTLQKKKKNRGHVRHRSIPHAAANAGRSSVFPNCGSRAIGQAIVKQAGKAPPSEAHAARAGAARGRTWQPHARVANAGSYSGVRCLSTVGSTWRPSPRSQTFEHSPTGVRDPNASNLDPRVAVLRGLKPYSCEFAADEIRYRLKLEPNGKQSIRFAALRRRCQDFEHLAISFGQSRVFELRGHFNSHHGAEDLPRRGVAILLSRSPATVMQPTQGSKIETNV